MGFLTLLQLLKLRLAWFDAAEAMNAIKRYYEKYGKAPELRSAFHWKPDPQGLGHRFRWFSVGFMLALQVAVLGGASMAAAIIFAGLAADQYLWLWGYAAAAIILWTVVQMLIYRLVLVQAQAKKDKATG